MNGNSADGCHREIDACIAALTERFGAALSTREAICHEHASGEGFVAARQPDAVLFAKTTGDVAAAVKICAAHRVPVIPFGVGTSLEGHVHAVCGGVTINLSGLDRILTVHPADLDVHVEAGVTREALNAHIRDLGLFFPLDPGANATLGGMAATGASGTNAVRYGTMREVTLGLTVVTPQGDVIHTGGRARKSSMGYDLTRLFVGSEGTLGIITELRLRVFGIPETIAAGAFQFAETTSAIDAVIATLQIGVPIARIEFLDDLQMEACIAWSKLDDFEAKPTLFVELHGSPASVADQRAQIELVFSEMGAGAPRWAERAEDRSRLWTARHNAYWAARALRPGHETVTTDACVPISELAEVIAEAKNLAVRSCLTSPIVGHVGDGNFHVMILHEPAQASAADALATAIAKLALRHGGTASGEHGVGYYRKVLLAEEHHSALAHMAAVKRALDPLNIMNPSKLFELESIASVGPSLPIS